MSLQSLRFAATALLAAALFAVPSRAQAGDEPVQPAEDVIPVVRSSRLSLNIQMSDPKAALSIVEAWYTTDDGTTWRPARVESETSLPVVFDVGAEGLVGLYLSVGNDYGTSAPPPQRGTPPQSWVFIDVAAPLVQIHSVQLATAGGERRVQIRYTAYDRFLADRPITLEYARPGQMQYQTIAARVALGGPFEWIVPANVSGAVVIRVTAQDRGGQVGSAVSAAVDVGVAPPNPGFLADAGTSASQPLPGAAADAANDDRKPAHPAERMADPDSDILTLLAATRAQDRSPGGPGELVSAGRRRAERGEWAVAEARFREALQADPDQTAARTSLATVLYKQRRFDDAEREYRAVLARRADEPTALAGLALVRCARKDFAAARDILLKLTEQRPEDPEMWIHLGDMQVLAGDPAAGRAAWQRARDLPTATDSTAARVRRRLLIYAEPAQP